MFIWLGELHPDFLVYDIKAASTVMREGWVSLCIMYLSLNTGCPRRNVKYFGRVFLLLNYTDITQNTYVQS